MRLSQPDCSLMATCKDATHVAEELCEVGIGLSQDYGPDAVGGCGHHRPLPTEPDAGLELSQVEGVATLVHGCKRDVRRFREVDRGLQASAAEKQFPVQSVNITERAYSKPRMSATTLAFQSRSPPMPPSSRRVDAGRSLTGAAIRPACWPSPPDSLRALFRAPRHPNCAWPASSDLPPSLLAQNSPASTCDLTPFASSLSMPSMEIRGGQGSKQSKLLDPICNGWRDPAGSCAKRDGSRLAPISGTRKRSCISGLLVSHETCLGYSSMQAAVAVEAGAFAREQTFEARENARLVARANLRSGTPPSSALLLGTRQRAGACLRSAYVAGSASVRCPDGMDLPGGQSSPVAEVLHWLLRQRLRAKSRSAPMPS